MDSVKVLSDVSIADIQRYLFGCKQPFLTSQLYSAARDEKFTDEDLRKSTFRSITDAKLFDLVESILAKVNHDDPYYKYTLRRNDITHIKYETGGFFKRHRDYLSTTSNLVEEYTLLVCVTENNEGVSGGDTIIHTYGGAKTFDTTTPGRGIIFRKDLEHEGTELIKGEKHIITANLWAVRKQLSSQVLLVTFPEEKGDVHVLRVALLISVSSYKRHIPDDINTKPSVKDVANACTSYVLPVDNLTGMLATHVQWANRSAEREGKESPPLVTYECTDFDYETFGVVYKILTRSYVEEEDIIAANSCLDFFGPFSRLDLLVKFSLETAAKSFDREATLTELRTQRVKSLKEQLSKHNVRWDTMIEKEELVRALCDAMEDRSKARAGKRAKKSEDFDSSLIICESEARMRAVINTALALGETDYVPFKILFVEGVLELRWEVDLSTVEVPMMPAACLVGDHNNIFCLRKIPSKCSYVEPMTLKEIHFNSNVSFKCNDTKISNALAGTAIKFNEWEYGMFICNDDEDRDHREIGYGLGLKVGLGSSAEIKSTVLQSILNETYDMIDREFTTIYLPGLDEGKEKEKDNGASLFHRNEKGEIAFTAKEADRASDFLASSNLEDRIKAELQKKSFVLPQETSDVNANFCNEAVYGKVNILWVCGVIRMKDGARAPEPGAAIPSRFNAWPSTAAKKATATARSQIEERIRLGYDYLEERGEIFY